MLVSVAVNVCDTVLTLSILFFIRTSASINADVPPFTPTNILHPYIQQILLQIYQYLYKVICI